MITRDSGLRDRTEECSACRRRTQHQVSIEVRAESEGKNAAFSREPYRVTECLVCGETTNTRMNNA
ncbi:hypothetical protein [Haladaptatus sp. DFWS20]|uniref:DUF7835 family putative zinc beta-ribbon protein n=1 Tax=Haladaptatus sp. DFWS20 TaxID=3403467 RepID=UPI003EBF01AA